MKRVLDLGKHPTFIGRELFAHSARNGGAFAFSYGTEDVAVALLNPRLNVLLVINVLPTHRSHGLGSAVLTYLQCSFARVLESAIPFFERSGYTSVGELHQGNRLRTQVMIKQSLLALAGRVSRIYGK